ncbi:M28 family metallopeptidase [Hyalangium rubrum]|uniref:M28 family peptidase n=1 Tax=Hyalangium rubrum TaxID=3103134 RepID=A0ABU5GUU4_9BACT|nr:M28 family peptidase [Hyalangium sp. s54d21]MDY7224946.1 M28 family peptidase [Hyalangium sp. s54d21]
MKTLRSFIESLCSDRCAGRAPGTRGSLAARSLVVEAFREAGLEPVEQPVPGCEGANVLASLRGEQDRWVLLAAHYDHLGQEGHHTYHGADDNAAAVAILLDVARALRRNPPKGRGILFAAFDGEEPPYFLTEAMGSEHFVRHPTVPLDTIDLMVCMDLVGHAVGPDAAPAEVRQSVFALGAERSEGTGALVDRLVRAEPGAVIRRMDAETIPPLSDYWGFWRRRVPFLFLTNGRWRHYHTPEDTPDKLDYPKIEATARWLERLTREACARPEPQVRFLPEVRDDASTLRSLIALTRALEPLSPMASAGRSAAEDLLGRCDATGRLSDAERPMLQMLVARLESSLA